MKTKFLYLVLAIQLSLNLFTIVYSKVNAQIPCVTSVTPTPTASAPTYGFNSSEIRRFPNPNNLVAYASIHDKNGYQLDGYSLHFAKDGSAIARVGGSTGFVQGLTHPPTIIGGNVITSSIPSFAYNLKSDFNPLLLYDGFTPVGTWVVYLQDRDGKKVSAEQTFIVIDGDPAMELYLDYTKN